MTDRPAGIAIVLFGAAVLLTAIRFPSVAGQVVGPSVFPSAIGIGLVVCGALLLATRQAAGAPAPSGAGDWRRPRAILNLVLVGADLVFFAAVVDALGFFLTAFAFLVVLLVAFGARRRWIVPVAALVTLAIHYGFYTLLRVPLPWGVLAGIAW
jgi:putative tricarboxylic transport membrane protein